MSDSHNLSVHQALGGGLVADVLMWKKVGQSFSLLIGATSIWHIFENAEHNFLAFVSNVLLLVISILFVWGKSATILNRPLPPVPNLEISEEIAVKVADYISFCVNSVSSVGHDIDIGGKMNRRVFAQVAATLWFISYVGSFFNFLTVVYVGVLLGLTLPVWYDKNQDLVDEKLILAYDIACTQYQNLDDHILSKIFFNPNKKKIQ